MPCYHRLIIELDIVVNIEIASAHINASWRSGLLASASTPAKSSWSKLVQPHWRETAPEVNVIWTVDVNAVQEPMEA